MRTFILVLILLALLAAAIAGTVYLWVDFGETEISTIGLLSMIGGGLVALLLGAGLMTLVFLSNRRGWDNHQGADRGRNIPPSGEDGDGGDRRR